MYSYKQEDKKEDKKRAKKNTNQPAKQPKALKRMSLKDISNILITWMSFYIKIGCIIK